MKNSRMTPERALALKDEADEIKRRDGIKHASALYQIATREGFRSWEELVAHAGGKDALRAAKPARAVDPRREAYRQRALAKAEG